MRLYLTRHGQALPPEQDPRCPLSPRGRQQIQALGQALAQRGVQPRLIWHSGKPRAQETAQIVAQNLALETVVRQHQDLAPLDPVEPMILTLARLDEDLLIVGHLPYLATLLARLTGAGARERNPFDTGSCICLQRAMAAEWEQQWALHPPDYATQEG